MSQRAGSRARGYLSRGALLALLLHVHLLAPIGVAIWVFGGRQEAAREAQRAQEVDVEFRDVTAAELPKDLPPIDPAQPDQLEPPKPPAPRAQARKPEQKLAEKKAEDKAVEKPVAKPEPEVAEPPPPRPEERKPHQKMVDLDNDKDGRAAAGRAVPRPEEQPRRPGDTREGHEPPEGAEGRGVGVGQVGSRRSGAWRRQAEDRRAGGQEVGAGAEGA